jgi:hypothetical protein
MAAVKNLCANESTYGSTLVLTVYVACRSSAALNPSYKAPFWKRSLAVSTAESLLLPGPASASSCLFYQEKSTKSMFVLGESINRKENVSLSPPPLSLSLSLREEERRRGGERRNQGTVALITF